MSSVGPRQNPAGDSSKLLLWKCYVLFMPQRWCLDWARIVFCFFAESRGWVTKKLCTEVTAFRQTEPAGNHHRLRNNACLQDICEFSSPCPCRQYLWCSCGPGRIQDVERVVGRDRNAVMRLSFGHLFLPVQTQLWTHWDSLLKHKE